MGMDFCEIDIHAGLVGEMEAEGYSREGRADRGVEYYEEALSHEFQSTFLSGNVWQATRHSGKRV